MDRGHLPTEQRLAAAAAIDATGPGAIAHTLRIINEQDATIHQAVARAIPQIEPVVQRLVEQMPLGGRVIYIGAGTSGRLGVLDASECPPTFQCEPDEVIGIIAGGDGALRKSSEGMEDDPQGAVPALSELNLTERDTLIGIAAGGTTPYVWGGLAYAKSQGCVTAFVTCVPLPDMPNWPKSEASYPVDHPIEVVTGPEVVTGSTRMKAGTATKLVLNMITTSTMIHRGKTWGNLMVDLKASNVKLRDRAIRILLGQAELDREAAGQLLDAAGGSVKTALVMAKVGCDASEAMEKIEAANGRLRPLIGSPK